MVRALHAAGLEVLLDVVYNHTAEGGADGPDLSLRGLDNAAYYRLTTAAGATSTSPAAATRWTCADPRALRLVTGLAALLGARRCTSTASGSTWPSALGRDRHGRRPARRRSSTAIAPGPGAARVKLIAEPWDVGAGGYQVGQLPAAVGRVERPLPRHRPRLLARRHAPHGVRRAASRPGLPARATCSPTTAARPFASVNFVTAHDGFTLRDLVSYDHKHNEANGEDNRDGTDNNRSWNCGVEGEHRRPGRRSRCGAAQDAQPAGDAAAVHRRADAHGRATRRGRTQQGNNNAYCQDNELSWVDWSPDPTLEPPHRPDP